MATNGTTLIPRPGELVWFHDRGYGYSPWRQGVYDHAYLEKYDAYSKTDRSKGLVYLRKCLVEKWVGDRPVLDFGCATPVFQEARGNTFGYDILPGVKERLGPLWRNPYDGFYDMTFWDSLEHLSEPWLELFRVAEWCFLSIPIFRDADHARTSKHFRPGEHVWYFTEPGLVAFMAEHGFLLRESNRMEEIFGREDIGSFAFQRGSHADL